MTRIILDASSSSKLSSLLEPVELCDFYGRVLGRFIPRIDISEWEPVSPDVSEEELDRREQSTERYSTEEVLDHLRCLEKQSCSDSTEWKNEAFSPMDVREILPPGQHPHDPLKRDIDPIGFALDRIRTFLLWIDEHGSSFKQLRHCDPVSAESELNNLRDSTGQALTHLQRLMELLLAGYNIDPNKRLPRGLDQGVDRLRSYLQRRRGG